MRLTPEQARERLVAAPCLRLATVRPDGAPHLGADRLRRLRPDALVFAVDPQAQVTDRLQRLANIAANPTGQPVG